MRTKHLVTCNSSFEANVLKGALQSEGIECILGNEIMTNLFGMVSLFSGVDVLVLEDDYQRALEILNRSRQDEPQQSDTTQK